MPTGQQVEHRIDFEEALRQSEQRYRSFVEASAQVIWRTNALGEVDQPIPSWNAFTGQSDEEASGFGWMNAVHPDDQPRVAEAWRQANAAKGLYQVEYRLKHHDGQWLHILARGVPVLEPDGRIREYIGTCIDVTEQRKAEADLRQSHERLEKVLEVETVGVMFWDLNTGCLVDANDTFLRMMGYSREDVETRRLTWQKLTPADYIAVSEAEVRKFQATGRVGPYEKEYLRKDGTRQWLIFAGSSLGGNQCVEFCVDIADRKKAEEAVRTRERDLVEAQRLAGLGSWEWDTQLNRVKWSKGLYRLVLLDEALPAPSYAEQTRFYTAETQRRLDEAVARATREGTPWKMDIEMIRTDGRRIWVTSRGEVVRSESGQMKGLRGTVLNITDRMRAEEALRESEERLRFVAERGGVGYWYWEIATNRLEWSPLCKALFGIPAHEPTSYERFLAAVHAEDRQRTDQAVRACLEGAGAQDYNIEYRTQWPDGTVHWIQARGSAAFKGGRPARMAGIAIDITPRKQAEEALRQAHADLEKTVAERTAQLVEANANLQSFAYTAAHDLRAPLRSIKSYAAMLAEEHSASPRSDGQFLPGRILGSADQMARLLDDLLEYSRIGQAEMKAEPVDLRKAVHEALSLLDGEIRARNAVITVTEPLPPVLGHAATVVLLINNFVSNAMKFVPPEVPPRVHISTDRTGNGVQLSVQDNGIGIAPGDLPKIFVAFQRLHNKQNYPGTGLGLAIVRKGAERMGGRVGVESEVGKGSRFWVELPRA